MNRTQKALFVTALIAVVALTLFLVSFLTPHVRDMGPRVVNITTNIVADNVVVSDSTIGSYTPPAPKADAPITLTETITHTPIVSYELDLLRLFNYEHGDLFTGNDDIQMTTGLSDGRPARVIVFDTSRTDLYASDDDKRSNLGKMITINTHSKIHADDGGVITMTLTTPTYLSNIQFLDVDHGSAVLTAFDSAGNQIGKPIKLHHGANGQVQIMNVNLVVSKVVIDVRDSFAMLPHFRAFSEGELKAFSLPKTLGECATTQADADMFHVDFCPAR